MHKIKEGEGERACSTLMVELHLAHASALEDERVVVGTQQIVLERLMVHMEVEARQRQMGRLEYVIPMEIEERKRVVVEVREVGFGKAEPVVQSSY